jgi:hypothetical protein
MSTHDEVTLAVNLRREGVSYPVGTPISDLPDLMRNDLRPFQVNGDLPAAEEEPAEEKPKRRARAPKPPTPEQIGAGASASANNASVVTSEDEEPF